jgi:hypothetical protein
MSTQEEAKRGSLQSSLVDFPILVSNKLTCHILQPTLMGIMNNEGDSVLNWSPEDGINKTVSDIVTTTLFNCNIALEATYEFLLALYSGY